MVPGEAKVVPVGRILPYLLAILGAKAACTCPARLWLPGVMGGWQPSLGHLLSAGQLPPAQLLVRLLVYHQQPGLPLHSLDPLDHLGQAGGSGSAASSPGSTWTVAPPKAGLADLLGVGGWTKRPAGSTPHPRLQQLPPSSPGAPDRRAQETRAAVWSQALPQPRVLSRRGGKLGEATVQACVYLCRSVLRLGLKERHLPGCQSGCVSAHFCLSQWWSMEG